MDKNEFLGWRVRVTTKSKSVIEGVVTEVNDVDCRLTLTDAQVTIGSRSRQVELVSVQGEDIVSLDVLTSASATPIPSASASMDALDPAIVRTSSTGRHDHPIARHEHPTHVARHEQTKSARSPWATDNVGDLKKTEFDIQGNLHLFDKKKAFEELKGSLRQEDLLVTHNARPRVASVGGTASLPSPKPVTTSAPASKNQSISKNKLFEDLQVGRPKKPVLESGEKFDKLDREPVAPVRLLQKPAPKAEDLVEERREELSKIKLTSSASSSTSTVTQSISSLSVVGGVQRGTVPIVSEETMLLIEQKASKLTGPTTDQQLESASREIMRVVLQEELVAMPSSAGVLVGNHREGAIALAVGRSLLNRGVSVTAWFSGNLLAVNDHVAFQRKLFLSAGGKCVDLAGPEEDEDANGEIFDVLIDGALGREGSLGKGSLFSLDSFKFHVLASIERSLSSKPDILFAIAFPKKHHTTVRHTSRLYLVDINLPVAAYKSALPDYQPMAVFGSRLSVRIR